MLKIVLGFLGLSLFFNSCSSSKSNNQISQSNQEQVQQTDFQLNYKTFGDPASKETLLFIHCWNCNQNYWKTMIPNLKKDYYIVTLDLPGHGESQTKILDWNFESVAKEIQTLSDKLKLKNVILVGHSMGGPLALKVAKLDKESVKGIACVDTLHNIEQKYSKEDFGMTEENFDEALAAFMPMMFHPQSDPALLQWTLEQSKKTNKKIALNLFDEYFTADFPKMMKEAGVPIRCVNAVPYSKMAGKTDVAINRKYADFDVIEMSGVGHFPQLEKPEEFLKNFRKALAELK